MSENKKTYRVTGIHPVHGAEPGDRFTAALSEAQERALVEGGAIKPVADRKPDEKPASRGE